MKNILNNYQTITILTIFNLNIQIPNHPGVLIEVREQGQHPLFVRCMAAHVCSQSTILISLLLTCVCTILLDYCNDNFNELMVGWRVQAHQRVDISLLRTAALTFVDLYEQFLRDKLIFERRQEKSVGEASFVELGCVLNK